MIDLLVKSSSSSCSASAANSSGVFFFRISGLGSSCGAASTISSFFLMLYCKIRAGQCHTEFSYKMMLYCKYTRKKNLHYCHLSLFCCCSCCIDPLKFNLTPLGSRSLKGLPTRVNLNCSRKFNRTL